MKRAGFTMIELIFVIVILGILAAVAIPKLAATRSDAEIAKMATNAATLLSDYGAAWTARADLNGTSTWSEVTNTPLEKTAPGTALVPTTDILTTAGLLTDGTETCVTFTPTAVGGLYQSIVVTSSGTGTVCAAVALKIANIASAAGTTHDFGGTGIK